MVCKVRLSDVMLAQNKAWFIFNGGITNITNNKVLPFHDKGKCGKHKSFVIVNHVYNRVREFHLCLLNFSFIDKKALEVESVQPRRGPDTKYCVERVNASL